MKKSYFEILFLTYCLCMLSCQITKQKKQILYDDDISTHINSFFSDSLNIYLPYNKLIFDISTSNIHYLGTNYWDSIRNEFSSYIILPNSRGNSPYYYIPKKIYDSSLINFGPTIFYNELVEDKFYELDRINSNINSNKLRYKRVKSKINNYNTHNLFLSSTANCFIDNNDSIGIEYKFIPLIDTMSIYLLEVKFRDSSISLNPTKKSVKFNISCRNNDNTKLHSKLEIKINLTKSSYFLVSPFNKEVIRRSNFDYGSNLRSFSSISEILGNSIPIYHTWALSPTNHLYYESLPYLYALIVEQLFNFEYNEKLTANRTRFLFESYLKIVLQAYLENIEEITLCDNDNDNDELTYPFKMEFYNDTNQFYFSLNLENMAEIEFLNKIPFDHSIFNNVPKKLQAKKYNLNYDFKLRKKLDFSHLVGINEHGSTLPIVYLKRYDVIH